MQLIAINPYYAARLSRPAVTAGDAQKTRAEIPHYAKPQYALLPRAPINASRVPHLTSLYHNPDPGPWGDRRYPGNCSGSLIKDLLLYFRPSGVFDPFSGSGTCREVCGDLQIPCTSIDIRHGLDACSASSYPRKEFDFVWSHPPYWRQKVYTTDPRDLSQQATLAAFLERYQRFVDNCAGVLAPGGKFCVLMGDYSDREAGFVPLVFYTLCGPPHKV